MSNELKHYGVLGMKWGVRRGLTSAEYYLAKGQKKAAKYRLKSSKLEQSKRTHRLTKAYKMKLKSVKVDDKVAKCREFIEQNKARTVNDLINSNPAIKKAYKNGVLDITFDQLGNLEYYTTREK